MAARSRKIAIGISLLAFAGFAAALVYELLQLPAKTTLIAAIAEDYHWPLPPNGWSREDIDNLKAGLDGQTLAVQELPLSGTSAGKALADLAAQFDRAAHQTRRDGSVIVYVSAHGVVDREGHPCLILPASDPLDSGSWLRVSDLLAGIKSVERHGKVHWLLVLDANRQDENWSIGLLQNSFAEGLAKAVADADIAGLAVLNSASPGEVGWSSFHLRGSVFGHFLRLGLAGAADENANGQVSLHELTRYLKKNIDAWTCKHRAAHQTPVLYPVDAADCPLAWSLNKSDLARMSVPIAKHPVAGEASAGGKLAALWVAHDRLESHQLPHYAPANWEELEHDLVWFEQAGAAGTSYRSICETAVPRLQARLDVALKSLQSAAGTGRSGAAPIDISASLSVNATLPLQDIRVYSSPLAEYLGTGIPSDAERFSEAELARLFEHYSVARLWPTPEIPRRAIELHKLGQQMAVPRSDTSLARDERAHAIVRPLLEEADQARRLAEDRVFLGPHEASDIKTSLDRASNLYSEIFALEVDLARNYQLRDRTWSELPCLAQWSAFEEELNDPAEKNKSATEGAKPKNRVLALTEAVARLDTAIRRAEQATGQGTGSLAAISRSANVAGREVADSLDLLHERLHNAARRLSLAPSTPKSVREITALLATPLISGTLRSDLYTHYLEVTEDVDSDAVFAASPTAGATSSDSQLVISASPGVPLWPVHPVVALLGRTGRQPIGDSKKNLLELGEVLRGVLRGTANLVPAAGGENGSAKHDVAAKTPAAVSSDLPDAERPLRRLASLQGASQVDSFRRIQRRHLQDLLLWHGRRALDDFWGSTHAGRQPYFAEVAKAYLADVRLVDHPDAEVDRSLQRIGSILDQRIEAAARGLATTSTDLVLIDAESSATARVSVQETPAAVGLPSGIATVFLRDDNAIVPQTLRRVDVGPALGGTPDASRNVTITLQGRDLTNRSAAMQAVAMFRGQEFPAPMMQRDVGGPLVEIQRPRTGPSRITMRGAHVKKASIVFILDCSHSMADSVPVEEPDASHRNAEMTKMNIAISAMQGMMERLGEEGDARVGVRFFGHRAGWRTDQANAMARQENYPGGVPSTLRPYEDIELFLPLGRFDSVTAGNVNRRLRTLKPWGESPIFLSLMEALKDFGEEDAHAERRVVVVTDGMNYQFNPPPEAAPSLKEVEDAYAGHGISVDIVGFGIPDEERSTAVRDFTQLAQSSKGSFTLATNASALIHRLDQLLVKTHFRVLDDAGRAFGEADLGGTITVAPQVSQTQVCTIEVDQLRTTTLLRGGESLQLAISRDGRNIISLPYEEESPIFVPLLAAESAALTGYHAGIHRRTRESDAVVFPISFQRDDSGIPLPPAQVWIEITPLRQSRPMSSNCYVFFDASYEPDLPVPLMRCRCRNWPKDSDQAEVRVWCRSAPVGPTEVVPLAKVADLAPLSGEGFELNSIPGVRFQVRRPAQAKAGDPLQIRVVERHRPSVPVNAVKAELFSPPSRITHQFDWDRGIVLHHFEYDPDNPAAGGPTELRFCSREKFTSIAWRMAQPVVVDIARHVEVVTPPRVIDRDFPTGRPHSL